MKPYKTKEESAGSRAMYIKKAVCRRLKISSEEFDMLVFEAGCDLAERYCAKETSPSWLTCRDLTSSNQYWYWWSKHFFLILKTWLARGDGTMRTLNIMLGLVRGPLPVNLQNIEQEINTKKTQK